MKCFLKEVKTKSWEGGLFVFTCEGLGGWENQDFSEQRLVTCYLDSTMKAFINLN